MKIDEVFGALQRDWAKVADLAKIPADRREEFFQKLDEYESAATEWDRVELLDNWNALSDADRLAVEGVRRKLLAAYNAALALTATQRRCIDTVGGTSVPLMQQSSRGPIPNRDHWLTRLGLLVDLLSHATCTYGHAKPVKGRGRPKGRTSERWTVHSLLEMVESCGGKLPSVDHDSNGSTINKIIKILQPHFPKGDLYPVSARTFRRVKKERKTPQP